MKDIYTIKELAKYWGVHPNTIRRWINEGTLSANKLGGTWRITKEQATAFSKAGK
ncbi:MAG: helix-turn-helix domain-containing protein [Candidatus Bathyarchaeia archaeon]|jgi:excisionase family DNA binding protein